MTKPILRVLFAAAALLIIDSRDAHAVDYLLSLGHPPAVSGSVPTVNAGDRFLIDLSAGRSYECHGVPSAADSEFSLGTSVAVTPTTGDATTVTAVTAGNVEPQITEGATVSGLARVVFTAAAAGRYAVTVATAKTGGEAVIVHCLDTTLVGGFNTFVNNFNFLELTNTSGTVITGTITAVDFAGATVITGQAFTVQPNSRTDVDLHTAAGPQKFGTVFVTNNGPFGALRGAVSQYRGTPLDFELSTSNPLQPVQPLLP